jgi:hypothetical protein
MIARNTSVSVAAYGEWRTLIKAEDRKASKVITYQLTPEELEKYRATGETKKQNKKPFIFNDITKGARNMAVKKITEEQLRAEVIARKGYNKEIEQAIAEKYGMTPQSVQYRYYNYKINHYIAEMDSETKKEGKDISETTNGRVSEESEKAELIDAKNKRLKAEIIYRGVAANFEICDAGVKISIRDTKLYPTADVLTIPNAMFDEFMAELIEFQTIKKR